MILIIDNYDSFTHNLYQVVSEIHPDVRLVRNDAITVEEIRKLKPAAIVISPGPGIPEDAGICKEVIQTFAAEIPILGICLGHQAIGIAFGGKVIRTRNLKHGKSSQISHRQSGILEGIPSPFTAGLYHSLMIEKRSLPEDLLIQAESEEGVIMAIKHRLFPCYGLQFHPESMLTPNGKKIIQNFLFLEVLTC